MAEGPPRDGPSEEADSRLPLRRGLADAWAARIGGSRPGRPSAAVAPG
jgi:hypothetical protein